MTGGILLRNFAVEPCSISPCMMQYEAQQVYPQQEADPIVDRTLCVCLSIRVIERLGLKVDTFTSHIE